MSEWRITIRVWPFSTNDGGDADKAKVGPEFQNFNVPALDDFRMACRFADAFLMGIKCNPAVWRAHITGVAEVRPE